MAPHDARVEAKLLGYLMVGEPLGQEVQDFPLLGVGDGAHDSLVSFLMARRTVLEARRFWVLGPPILPYVPAPRRPIFFATWAFIGLSFNIKEM